MSIQHKVYSSLVNAIKMGTIKEPFTIADFQKACPGFGKGTHKAFPYKHRAGNRGQETELFELVSPGQFKFLRPFKYDL
jgi:hypothetical protein